MNENQMADARTKLQIETSEAISRIRRESNNNSTYIGIDCTNIFIDIATLVGLGITCAYFFSKFKF